MHINFFTQTSNIANLNTQSVKVFNALPFTCVDIDLARHCLQALSFLFFDAAIVARHFVAKPPTHLFCCASRIDCIDSGNLMRFIIKVSKLFKALCVLISLLLAISQPLGFPRREHVDFMPRDANEQIFRQLWCSHLFVACFAKVTDVRANFQNLDWILLCCRWKGCVKVLTKWCYPFDLLSIVWSLTPCAHFSTNGISGHRAMPIYERLSTRGFTAFFDCLWLSYIRKCSNHQNQSRMAAVACVLFLALLF